MIEDKKSNDMIYGIDDIPPVPQSITLGLQHYLTMLGSTVAIPLFLSDALGLDKNNPEDFANIAILMATMFFVSGVATILQTTLGNKLPIVQGGTFSYLAPTFAILGMAHLKSEGFEVRMAEVQGAIIVGGLVQVVIGYSGLVGKFLKYIGPITIAPTIALIGLALYPFGVAKVGEDWVLGGGTILLMILFSQVLRKKHRVFELFPVLLAMLLAWVLAFIFTGTGYYEPTDPGYIDLSKIKDVPLFNLPTPLQWGMPTFGLAAIVAMFAGVIAGMIESIGDYYACARMSGAPIPTKKVINKGIGMEGIGCILAGVFGTGNGTTSYSENIGAIGLTRVGSRRVVQFGAGIMILLGLFPMFSAFFASLPGPIIGGMYCTLFGMIAAVGLSNLQFIDLNSSRNLFIIGMAIYLGLSAPVYYGNMSGDLFAQFEIFKSVYESQDLQWLQKTFKGISDIIIAIGKTGMAVGAIVALILDNVIPGTPKERGMEAWNISAGEDEPSSA